MAINYTRNGIKWSVDFEGKTEKSLPKFSHGEIPPDHIGFFNRCSKIKKIKCRLNAIQVPEYGFEIFVFPDGSNTLVNTEEDPGMKAQHECDVLLLSGVHPREWEAQLVMLEYMKRLFFSNGNGDGGANDAEPYLKINVKCIPCLNFPGFLSTLHTQQHEYFSVVDTKDGDKPIEPDESYRMTRKYLGENGVDLNRNHNFFWSHSENAKDPCYEGTHPHSQPETEYLEKLVMASNLLLILDLHNYGNNVVDFPLVDPALIAQSPHCEDLNDIQKVVVPVLKSIAGDIFLAEELFHPYNGAGVFSDWAIVQGCIGCTIEVGPQDEAFQTTGHQAKKNIDGFMTQFWRSFVLNYEHLDHTQRLLKHILDRNKLQEFFV